MLSKNLQTFHFCLLYSNYYPLPPTTKCKLFNSQKYARQDAQMLPKLQDRHNLFVMLYVSEDLFFNISVLVIFQFW